MIATSTFETARQPSDPAGIAVRVFRQHAAWAASYEFLEQRLLLTVPAVVSIDRSAPPSAGTSAAEVTYVVTFSEPVTNVSSADFALATTGSASAPLPFVVTGSGAVYSVKAIEIQGSGTLRIDLIDDDSIRNVENVPLGGSGAGNGNFQGQTYQIDPIAPFVQSINGANPIVLSTGASSVTYAVTFSEPVMLVDPTDFSVSTTGTVSVVPPVVVNGSGSTYSVTINGISGSGSLRLNLVDNGTIHDMAGNHLITVNAPATFAAATAVSAGLVPVYLVSDDLNKDGKPDLVVANFLDNNVGIRLGNGNGTFQNAAMAATGLNPNCVTISDVNGDGQLDLIVANLGSNTVGVLLGNGNGTFQPQTTFPTGEDPHSVAVADINGDGRPDLAVANFSDNTIGILLGNGDGTFQAQSLLPTSMSPQSLQLADVNGNGINDVIVINFDNSNVGVLLGNGDGTFQGQLTFPTGWKPRSLAVVDVNADQRPDLVVANSGDNNVGVLLGNGNGTFQNQTTYFAGSNPQSVKVADVNGDGKRDLIVASFADHRVGVLLGNGNGTFQNQTTFAAGTNPQSVVVADVNLDNKPDLLTANFQSFDISVLLGNMWGNFAGQIYTVETATHLTLETLPGPSTAGIPLNSPTGIRVAVRNQYGQIVTDDMSTVTVSLVGGTFAGGGTTAMVPVINGIATFASLVINAAGTYSLNVSDGSLAGAATPNFQVVARALSRHLFYAGSSRYHVTNSMYPGFSDDNAIASDKVALLPGAGTATFANVSSFSDGITGIMFDLLGSGGSASITAADFTFKIGNNNTPSGWAAAPAPATVTVRAGAGVSGSDRVELIWNAGSIVKTWLEVKVASNARTALAAADVFYFGNALGDSGLGNTPSHTTVNSVDEAGVRQNPQSLFDNIPLTNIYDYNRDGRVNSTDENIARINPTNLDNAVNYLHIGPPPTGSVVSRHLFYAGSSRYHVTNSMYPGFSDDNAIASDKVALLPGAGTATFANVSSFSDGITGIMFDLLGSGGSASITAADFTFKIGNNNTPSGWAAAPAPATVTVRAGAGVSGSDRVELIWNAGSIVKTWLEVKVASNARTALAAADVFYFGNALGDSGLGNTPSHTTVNSVDEAGPRQNPQSLLDNIPLTNIYDYNRDGRVNSTDENIARINPTNLATAVNYLNIGVSVGGARDMALRTCRDGFSRAGSYRAGFWRRSVASRPLDDLFCARHRAAQYSDAWFDHSDMAGRSFLRPGSHAGKFRDVGSSCPNRRGRRRRRVARCGDRSRGAARFAVGCQRFSLRSAMSGAATAETLAATARRPLGREIPARS